MLTSVIERYRELAGKQVFVGLSGGVDSAVAAAILQRAGLNVTGVFMKNWAGEDGLQIDCPWEEDLLSAQSVASHLGIEFRSHNFEREYKEHVLDYFFSEYEAGRTPNPDILCNSEIKFKAFLNKSLGEGADYIATGHYSSVSTDSNSRTSLHKAMDTSKDQTYFLSGLEEDQLKRSLFPLGSLLKTEVRSIAKELNLPNAGRKDSQGICFIGDLDVQQFLRKYIPTKPGEIRDIDTDRVVGNHDGISFYTIGQREGLGIGGVKEPYYVAKRDRGENILYVANGRDNSSLWSQNVRFSNLHIVSSNGDSDVLRGMDSLSASVRYRQKDQPGAFVSQDEFHFEKKQWAISPGQSLVFYSGEVCLGNAVID